MNEKLMLKKSEELARKVHKGQTRWNGQPYITHPEAVANACKSNDCKAVAWLHDVIEDTEASYKYLEENGIPKRITQTLAYLTRVDSENYCDYILNIATDKEATEVKIADLKHNLSDLKKGSMRDKYLLALHILEKSVRSVT